MTPVDHTSPVAILIVEDERIVAMDLRKSLERLGYAVAGVASSAEDAVRTASEQRPDLVLMDIRIKGAMDGIDTAEVVRRRFGVPVVFLTAHTDEVTLDRAKRAEPFGYVVKPLRSSELRRAVELALYKHAMDVRLRERERWFATTLRSIADAVVATDDGGRVTLMNAAAEALTGWSSDDACDQPFEEVVSLTDQEAVGAPVLPVRQVLEERLPFETRGDLLLVPKQGSPRAISAKAAPILDEGRLLGAVMVFHDVSDQRRLQRQLELADRLAALGTLAAGVAHEISSPLASVLERADFAGARLSRRDGPAPADASAGWDELKTAVADIRLGAERIHEIVTDLTAYAAPAGPPGAADVVRLVKWAVQICLHDLRHRAQVVTDYRYAPPVLADDVRLGQVFLNLLVNAGHAIASGDAEHNEIRVTTGTDAQGRAVIEIKDTGGGMSEEVRQRIFEPFFTTKGSGIGAGLGLPICHRIIRSLGGDLVVESELGKGATFRVLLPPGPLDGMRPHE